MVTLNAPFNTQVADRVKGTVAILEGIGPNATWFETAAFAPVSEARFGTAGRNSVRGPGATNLDLGLARNFAIREWLRFELRGEAFNFTITPTFANPGGNISAGTAFGRITSTVGGAAHSRVIRFAWKFTF